jgi:hypothetical protein
MLLVFDPPYRKEAAQGSTITTSRDLQDIIGKSQK